MTESSDHEELLRTRARIHKMESTLIAIKMRLDQMSAELHELGPRVDRLARNDEIAEAVAKTLKARGDVIQIRWIGKLVGLLVALAAVGSFVLQAIGHK